MTPAWISVPDPCVDPRPGAADPPADRRRRAGLGPEPGRPQSFARRRRWRAGGRRTRRGGGRSGGDEAPGLPGDAGPLAGDWPRSTARSPAAPGPRGDATRAEFSAIRLSTIGWRGEREARDVRHLAEMAQSERPSWRRLAVGRLGKRTAARAPGLARPLLVAAVLRARQKNAGASVVCESALRCIRRGSAGRLTRRAGRSRSGSDRGRGRGRMKNHDSWLLARRGLESQVKTRRSSSKLPALVNSC